MSVAVTAYVALGANLGDPVATVRAAIDALRILPGVRFVAASSLYRTAPVGLHHQPDFINAVAALETSTGPRDLLADLFAIEARFGRLRTPGSARNAARTLDLDLLLWGDVIEEHAALTLPHPRMTERAFVLAPLAEIAPDLEIPGRGRVADLLAGTTAQRIARLT